MAVPQLLVRLARQCASLRISQSSNRTARRCIYSLMASAVGGGALYFVHVWMRDKLRFVPVLYASQEENEKADRKMSYRELRFHNFASVEYDGIAYMTPQDFLESVTEKAPRPRIGRGKLTRHELESWLRSTPKRSQGSEHLFRSIHDKGIISYTEYLFLLCVLTKPHSGFRIAFNMFDTDGNQIVDKREFLVLESFFALPKHERKFVPRDQKNLQKTLNLERVFSKQGQRIGLQPPSEQTELEKEVTDTTLLVHFFGPKGTDVLNYQDFHRFMENLQSEVIELEFHEFSHGMSTISEVSFATILLRYTNLHHSEIEECLERVRQRMPEEKGISFEEFKKFCQFLNNLDDFALTMKMYSYAEKSVSQEDFQRAVKVCTGYMLGPHVVNTVFQIFDSDGDGNLSHQEFINIMKDRLHRGARSHLMHTQNTWDAFRSCVRNEMRSF
ncbi:calcium uptake protein 3, mitochondrial-like isoform X3 [Pomacea canaliculata]|uniref:calcium uptake protein 3, mitochondrial-like isoform X3 n=1 Tax=Pomacea canaliculata TaxID=400727 RepID=UPI000D73D138|nr:calcium uptake protein 3, mitochondrial-like isoform X3 [Pomacea canaliculata]